MAYYRPSIKKLDTKSSFYRFCGHFKKVSKKRSGRLLWYKSRSFSLRKKYEKILVGNKCNRNQIFSHLKNTKKYIYSWIFHPNWSKLAWSIQRGVCWKVRKRFFFNIVFWAQKMAPNIEFWRFLSISCQLFLKFALWGQFFWIKIQSFKKISS